MTIRHIKIFIQVFQTKNITRAAQLLHMTQPAVTRAIQEMEHYYGVFLFERLNRRLYITESGKQLYSQALHIAESFDLMEKGLRNWDEFGILRIGASITLGNFLLPQLVSIYQGRHPNLQIRATISNGYKLQQMLYNNQLDFALIENEVSQDRLKMEPFSEDQLILILPPNHPLKKKAGIQLRDLTSYPFLLRESGSVGRTFLNHIFSSHGMILEPLWESASTQAIVKAVSIGIGISFLPEQLVKADIENGTIATCPISDAPLIRKNYIVWHQNKFLTKSALEFISLCKNKESSPLNS